MDSLDKTLNQEIDGRHDDKNDPGKTLHNTSGGSPRRTLQHRHTYNNFNNQESLSKDEARRRMLSWRKTTKFRKATTPSCGSSSVDDKSQLPDKNCTNFGARKRGVFMGSKKAQSMGQY